MNDDFINNDENSDDFGLDYDLDDDMGDDNMDFDNELNGFTEHDSQGNESQNSLSLEDLSYQDDI